MVDMDRSFAALEKLLEVSPDRRPWAQIEEAFRRMQIQEAGRLLRERPAVAAHHLWSCVEHRKLSTAGAIADALSRVGTGALSADRVVAAVVFAAAHLETAKSLVQSIGTRRAAKTCVRLCREPDRHSVAMGAQAFGALCDLDLKDRLHVLPRWLKSLCQNLPESDSSPRWAVYYAACETVKFLLAAHQQIPELEQRLQELAACPPLTSLWSGTRYKVTEELIKLLNSVREHAGAAQCSNGKGHWQSLPGARAFILSLARCHVLCISSDRFGAWYERNPRVTEALRTFPADEVTDVVLNDFLPASAELAKGQDLGPLHLAVSMLMEDPAARRGRNVLEYCRQALRAAQPITERPTWPLGMLAALGAGGANVIREFLMEKGRARMAHWDFEAEQALAEALRNCSTAEAEPCIKALLDDLLSGDSHLSYESELCIRDLHKEAAMLATEQALNRLEAKEELSPQTESMLLYAAGGYGRCSLQLSESWFERAVDAALGRCESMQAGVHSAALWLSARLLRSALARDWQGWSTWSDHPRLSEIADAAVLGLGDPEENVRGMMYCQLCESTHDHRPELALPMLKALVMDPGNQGLHKVLAYTVTLGSGYWGQKMIGLRTDHPQWLKQALIGRDPALQGYAAQLFPWVLKNAPDEVCCGLLGWLECQLAMPRNRRRLAAPAVLNFARCCPELAGKYPWVVEHAARCQSWKPFEKFRILKLLCRGDHGLLARLMKEHDPGLVDQLDSRHANEAAMLLAADL